MFGQQSPTILHLAGAKQRIVTGNNGVAMVAREGMKTLVMGDPIACPSLSVVVCTRNRPDLVANCLGAILCGAWPAFELVVVDQSTDDRTARVVQGIAERDPRVKFVRDQRKGLSRGRNLAIQASSGDLIVFTDDDCEPTPNWLQSMLDALVAEPHAGLAFGAVIPADFDSTQGFIVGHRPRRHRRLMGRLGRLSGAGIGANMAVRREALQRTGGFDELLGAGAYFPSAEDHDMAYRVLAAGFAVLQLPESQVVHYGFRDWADGSALMRGTYLAVGATWAKHARLGDAMAYLLLLRELWLATYAILKAALRRRRPFGVGRLAALLIGMLRTFELDVSRRDRVYVRKPV